jgi:hypothetical protein
VFKSNFKFLTVFILIAFTASTAFATPHTRTRGSKPKSTSGRKSGTSKMMGNTSGKPNSYYSGITNHEAAAEKQKELDAEYQEQLKAAKEGRPFQPITGVGIKSKEQAAKKAALDERRTKLAEERELRRLEREEKKEERLAAAAERKAKREERKAGGKKKDKDIVDVEAEISKKPKAKVKTEEPDKLENF